MPKQVSDSEVVESRTQQSENSKRATFDMLKSKKRAEREVVLQFPGEDGTEEITMLFRAVGSQVYDKLLSKNPPTTEQKADGSVYNINTFGPDLLSKVCVDPDLSPQQWREIWQSEDWNRGEVMQLFVTAAELCNKGLDIPFFERD